MPTENQRREDRIEARVPVEIHRRRAVVRFETSDVSFRGLFVRTGEPSPLRSLVRLRVNLPGLSFEAHAMVVHVLEGEGAGMGLQFWGLSGPDRIGWDAFVGGLLHERRLQAKRLKEATAHPANVESPSGVRFVVAERRIDGDAGPKSGTTTLETDRTRSSHAK